MSSNFQYEGDFFKPNTHLSLSFLCKVLSNVFIEYYMNTSFKITIMDEEKNEYSYHTLQELQTDFPNISETKYHIRSLFRKENIMFHLVYHSEPDIERSFGNYLISTEDPHKDQYLKDYLISTLSIKLESTNIPSSMDTKSFFYAHELEDSPTQKFIHFLTNHLKSQYTLESVMISKLNSISKELTVLKSGLIFDISSNKPEHFYLLNNLKSKWKSIIVVSQNSVPDFVKNDFKVIEYNSNGEFKEGYSWK